MDDRRPLPLRSRRPSSTLHAALIAVTLAILGALFMGCEGRAGPWDSKNSLGGPDLRDEPRTVQFAEPDPSSSIRGRVFDTFNGRELPGTTVRINGTPFSTVAGPGGSYAFTGLSVGSYRLEANRTGYSPFLKGLTLPWKGTLALDVGLTPIGIQGGLRGTVVDGATGRPLPNVRVLVPEQAAIVPLSPTGQPVPFRSVLTDQFGRFTLEPLPAGQLLLTFAHPSFRSMEASVDIAPNQTVAQTFNLLYNTGEIRGTVRSTRALRPVTAAQVTVLGAAQVAVTDGAGKYSFPDLTGGKYVLEFAAWGHDRSILTTTVVASRITTADVRLRYNLASLFGTVRDANTIPLASVVVSIPALGLTTNTDPSGRYDFGYTIRIANPPVPLAVGLAAQNYANQALTISLVPEQRLQLNVTMYAQTGNLYGTVRSSVNAQPIQGASVRLPIIGQSRTTDLQGVFSFFAIAPIVYQADVVAAGYTTLTTYVPVFAGRTARVDIRLTP